MANPVLIAKLALVAADPKTWQKIIIACISIQQQSRTANLLLPIIRTPVTV